MDYKELSDAIDKKVQEKRRNYKGPHCCFSMDVQLHKEAAFLYYDSQYREYGIDLPIGGVLLVYCMFCGKKLPESLRREWHDILEQEYGLESPDEEDQNKVPQEFWTDEWWKQRGL